MANRNLKGDVNVQFEEPTSRINLDSGSSVKTLFGRISKWLKDLKAVAFSGSYTDLSDKPTIPPATAVKGNAETTYRTGNVNLTPANIGLGNVNNTSDANKPISTATQAALDKQQAQVNAALKQTGYNLLKITEDTQTINGVTFTVDKAAGTITANGTANQLTFFAFRLEISDGEYILTGCPPTGSDSTYRIDIRDAISGITFTNAVDYGTGTSAITLSGNKYFNIRIANGYNCSDLVFKPMIVPAELAGVPFQPYAKSNAELTADIPLTIHIDYSNIDAHTCDSTYNECLSALESGRAVIAMIQITSKLMRTCFFGLDTDTKIICGEIPNGSTTYDFDWRAGEDCPSIGISS